MARNLLFVVDPLASLNPKTDTTLAMMESLGARGFNIFACEIGDIVLDGGRLCFVCAPVHVPKGYDSAPQYLEQLSLRSSDQFSAVFMRKDPPVDQGFFTALLMLRHYDAKHTVMLNNPDSLLLANEKLFGLDIAPEFFPKTLVVTCKSVIKEFISHHDTVVLKPLFGAGGAGVVVTSSRDANLGSLLELLTADFKRPVMVQEYIANARAGDKRIIIVGGKPLGAILRVPNERDHRANFHAGGTPLKATLTERDLQIVESLAPQLQSRGLHLVGIDIIGGFLTEINVTSPTGILEIEQFSQKPDEKPLRELLADYVETLLA